MIRSFSLNLLLSFLLAGFGWAETNVLSPALPQDTNEVTPLSARNVPVMPDPSVPDDIKAKLIISLDRTRSVVGDFIPPNP